MGRLRREPYQLLIVGAGPAGCAAAVRARRAGLSTLLVERKTFPRPRECLGWIGPAGIALCDTLGLGAKAAGAAEFTGLRLHSWDLKRSAETDDQEVRGWIVDRATFDHALVKTAKRAGADVVFGVSPTALTLGERHATLQLSDERAVSGRILLIADGMDSQAARLANLPAIGRVKAPAYCAQAAYKTKRSPTELCVVLGGGREGKFVTLVRSGRMLRVGLFTHDAPPAPQRQLAEFCEAAEAAGILSGERGEDLPTRASPAGAALDLDSHVGKGCLVIGDAGGFVAAFSNEGVYPAMRSGWLAAETAERALQAPVPQDELATFGAAWRSELADYLRMPNTDLSLLMPLVFNNPQMSKRVARAFLLGTGF